jgi:serine/threonine protein kinase
MLAAGSRLGAYEIVSPLGAGGMGEVYQATDTVLKRQVALKVLPPEVANDPERVARFQREAEVLASLNHPNIAHLYGLERSGGTLALVMELVEGPTLADRIAQGAIPVDEALPIAKQIAEALEAAHEQGIIHRDLKPANIKVREDGTVKVLDFGLAKAMEPASSSGVSAAAVTNSPTITSPALMTGVGVLLGTAAYMSPEQAKGRSANKRSDIWAFGCVLYEVLTGRRAFDGEDVSDTLAGILRGAPDWSKLPSSTPSSVRRALRRCLEKAPHQRLADMSDVRLDLEDWDEGADTAPASTARARRSEWFAWCAAAGMIIVAAAGWVYRLPRDASAIGPVHVDLSTPPTSQPESIAISGDGRTVAYVADSDGRSQLWVRPLDSERGHPLAGTDNATLPFWSPDNKSMAFFADVKLKKIDLESGAVTELASVRRGSGGTWNRAGIILFGAAAGPILRVSEKGGEVTTVISLADNAPNGGYRKPQFLPDGRHFICYAVGLGFNRVIVGDIKGESPVSVIDSDSAPVYGAGHLLFLQRGRIVAQPLDARTLHPSGPAVPIGADSVIAGGLAVAPLSISETGTVVYRSAGQVRRRQFTWVDRSGGIVGSVGEVDATNALNPELSPDGRHIAYNRTFDNNTDVWVLDTSARQPQRFTDNPAVDQYPIWSPDGERLAFSSIRPPGFHVYEKPLSGITAPETPLVREPSVGAKIATDWSREFLLYRHLSFTTGYDIWAMPMTGDRKPFPVVQTDSDEREGQFSPDGKWIAYESDQSGRMEIYVQAFPKPGQVFGPFSSAGGVQPRWNPDGKELFYLSPASEMMSVKLRAEHDTMTGAPATMLFRTRVLTNADTPRQQYAVSKDGQRFLVNQLLDEGVSYPLSVILNWSGAKP